MKITVLSKEIIMSDTQILLVEDEVEIADLVRLYLTNEGFRVHAFNNGTDALLFLSSHSSDLAILDIMLPDMNGLTICQEIRKKYTFPVIILTALGTLQDTINGLALGADDYVTKPFRIPELVARVKAQLRRAELYSRKPCSLPDPPLSYLGLTLYPAQHVCELEGKQLHVTPTEFCILELLLQNLGKPVSAEYIFQSLWQEEYFDKENNTIMVHIRRLRDKMGEDYRHPRYIQTVWGVGYKMG